MDDGTYCIGNPGEGIMQQRLHARLRQDLSRRPRPKRIYRGVQLDVTKRFSNNWQAIASYIYSKLDGNFDGEYSPFTNVGADPNISAAYDYYDFFTDGQQPLAASRTAGRSRTTAVTSSRSPASTSTPWKLSVGRLGLLPDGHPADPLRLLGHLRPLRVLPDRPRRRRPDAGQLRGGPPPRIPAAPVGPVTVNILVDVFNVLNAQRPVLLDQRWGFQESDNTSPTPVNPNYGKPVFRTPPTSARLGARISF